MVISVASNTLELWPIFGKTKQNWQTAIIYTMQLFSLG